jgi:signal transduction histidine kinase/DNA-binding response OmpR family regulator
MVRTPTRLVAQGFGGPASRAQAGADEDMNMANVDSSAEAAAGPGLLGALTQERLAAINARSMPSLAAGALFTLIVAAVMWGLAPNALVLGWAGVRLALCAVRYAETRRFARQGPAQEHKRRWHWRYGTLLAFEGLSWAALPYLFVPYAPATLAMLLMASVPCVATLGLFTLTSHAPTAALWVACTVAAALPGVALNSPGYEWPASLTMLLYMAVLMFEALRNDRRWAELVGLRLRSAAAAAAHERATRAAESASRARSSFLAAMSHELRTPLNGMLGLAELLLQSPLGQAQRHYVELSRGSAQQLLGLVDEVLDFTSLQAGGLALAPAPTSLRALINEVVAEFEPRARGKGIALTLGVAREVPQAVSVDAARLRQVLWHLIGNAIKFTTRGGVELMVSARGGGEGVARVRFAVTDTGPGVAADQRELIFAPFERGDSSAARVHGGAGLGLTISATLVEMMGSSLRLDSGESSGSRFHFELELPVAALAPAPPAPARPAQASFGGLRVLVVEDNDINALVLIEALRVAGAQVERARDGDEALARVAGGVLPYDLVLMDLQMPRIDGFTATRELRRRDSRARSGAVLPIIAVTANAMAGDREACLAAGFDDYLAKPIAPQQLLDVIGARLRIASPADWPPGPFGPEGQGGDGRADFDSSVLAALPMVADGTRPGIADELLALALRTLPQLLDDAERSAAAGDAPTHRRSVHTIKSSAAQIGALRLADCAEQLEARLRGGTDAGGAPLAALREAFAAFEQAAQAHRRWAKCSAQAAE